jgi:hypothetical protein
MFKIFLGTDVARRFSFNFFKHHLNQIEIILDDDDESQSFSKRIRNFMAKMNQRETSMTEKLLT